MSTSGIPAVAIRAALDADATDNAAYTEVFELLTADYARFKSQHP